MSTEQQNKFSESEYPQKQETQFPPSEESSLSEESSCTLSAFVSIGCDIDTSTIEKKSNTKSLFSNRGKRLVRYLYSRQIKDTLNGNTRPFLDQQAPISQIKYYIPSLINTILASNNNIYKIFIDLLFFKYRWFTILLAISLFPLSTNIQLLIFPTQVGLTKIGVCVVISLILILLFLCTNLFGFSHDQNIKQFSPDQVDIETYTKAKIHVKEYLIKNYSILEEYLRNIENTKANESHNEITPKGFFSKSKTYVKHFIRNRLLKIGLCLAKEDVLSWIKTATGTSIEELIEEGKTRKENNKYLNREEQLIETIKKLTTKYRNKIAKLKQDHEQAILELNNHHKGEIAKLTKDHEEAISKLNDEHNKETKDLNNSKDALSRDLKKLKKDHQDLLRTRGMTLDDLENCPTPIDDAAFPRVTIGLVVKTLRKKNPFVTRAVIALFITALVLSTKKRPLAYEDEECRSCKQFHAALLRTTWLALFSDDTKAIDTYNKETPQGLLSLNVLSSPLYVEDPRSTGKVTKEEDLEPNCPFSVWRTHRQPSKTMS